MRVKPKAQAAAELAQARREAAEARREAARKFERVRAVLMANSWLWLGDDHPEAWRSREADRLIGGSNGLAAKLIRWGLTHRDHMAQILGYDPLSHNGSEPGGVAVQPTPATPPAKPEP